MLRTMKSLIGYRLHAIDDSIGTVNDIYFDDDRWYVRYIVADTGNWLPGRLVLLSPQSLREPDSSERRIPAGLTRKQIEESPSVSTDRPVSRQLERDLHGYFGWVPYWSLDMPPVDIPAGRAQSVEATAAETDDRTATATARRDPHLRSCREVTGYRINASDDQIGHVEDFVVDCADWEVRYMIVDTRNWLPGRRVIVAPQWVSSVQWPEHEVSVDLTRDQIEGAPEFDDRAPINREYEAQLYDYYGRPCYWKG